MKTLLPAFKKNTDLLDEVDSCLSYKEGFDIWWLGQSGYLLQWQKKRILIDPYLSDSLTKKYAQTEKPHIRMSELVVDPHLLKNITIVTSSHNHTDHLDGESLVPVLENNPDIRFVIPEANREFVADRVACDNDFPIGMNDGTSVKIEGITIDGIPAKHNELARDVNGNCKYMGYVFSFGEFSIYHSGDTLWFDEMVDLLKPYDIDLAILPINGNDPARKVAGNLNAQEAVALGKAIDAKYVIPCHYDMFTFNTADVREFIAIAETEGQPYKVLQGGERFRM